LAIGTIAFGSLLDDPGDELRRVVLHRTGPVETPFAVEFARSSKTRAGAPTLVPVASGGARVAATVLVLDRQVDEALARDLLYRRETWRVGQPVSCPPDLDWIAAAPRVGGVEVCLYTALPANVAPLTASRLAELAIASARAEAGALRRDGISYLREQKRRGLVTPLSPAYEAQVLRRTGARTLSEAWTRLRPGA
jgi:hypothetical protein